MKTSKFLVAVRSYSLEVSKEESNYYKVELQSFARKDEDSNWVEDTSLDMIRVSKSTFKVWMKGKLSPSNILIIGVEHRIAGVTSYIKDEVQKFHTVTGREAISVLQATLYDIVDVSRNVDIEDYKQLMFQSIKQANLITRY